MNALSQLKGLINIISATTKWLDQKGVTDVSLYTL